VGLVLGRKAPRVTAEGEHALRLEDLPLRQQRDRRGLRRRGREGQGAQPRRRPPPPEPLVAGDPLPRPAAPVVQHPAELTARLQRVAAQHPVHVPAAVVLGDRGCHLARPHPLVILITHGPDAPPEPGFRASYPDASRSAMRCSSIVASISAISTSSPSPSAPCARSRALPRPRSSARRGATASASPLTLPRGARRRGRRTAP